MKIYWFEFGLTLNTSTSDYLEYEAQVIAQSYDEAMEILKQESEFDDDPKFKIFNTSSKEFESRPQVLSLICKNNI